MSHLGKYTHLSRNSQSKKTRVNKRFCKVYVRLLTTVINLEGDRTRKCAGGVANTHLFIATVEFKVKMKFTIVTVHHNMCDTSTYLMQYKSFLLTF